MSFKVLPKLLVRLIYNIIIIITIYLFIDKGGIFRGNAVGNVYNWGDAGTTEPPIPHQRGSVFLYLSSENPTSIIPSQSLPAMKTSINVFNSTKPLFEALAKKFPEVASDSE
jgi:hypothetical protein